MTRFLLSFAVFILYACPLFAERKIIHVFVPLCDNVNQGIVPVPEKLGNGEDPRNNLYWGAMYGVKAFFKRSSFWKLIRTEKNPDKKIIERCIFKHKSKDVYMVADAYRGSEIENAVIDFLWAAAFGCVRGGDKKIQAGDTELDMRKTSLVAYCGHDGLMDFKLSASPVGDAKIKRKAIVLACFSRKYFSKSLATSKAEPLLMTNGLMAPEAYVLEAAVQGWIKGKSSDEIVRLAAKAYSKYQKCSLNAAMKLFSN